MFPLDLNAPMTSSGMTSAAAESDAIDNLFSQFNNTSSFISNSNNNDYYNKTNLNGIFINSVIENEVEEFSKSIFGIIQSSSLNSNIINSSNNNRSNTSHLGIGIAHNRPDIPFWLIPCYGIILLFAIVGNLLVISTLLQNRRMRTITNVFLLNLAISDMLLGVLCMPVTLVGTLLRHFIFGEVLCKLFQFSQATSVAVSSWTLVAISCERYYAICHPLSSRAWQTISHAYKIIGFIWIGSIICMMPIALFSQLIPTSRQGLRKCREYWPDYAIVYERPYNLLLDLFLLVLPLLILSVAYILITRTLYVGMRNERAMIFGGSTKESNAKVEATVATVTTTTTTPTGFNFNMYLRCHTSRSGNLNSDPDVYQQEHQLQQQHRCQQHQEQQQQHNYDDIMQSSSKSRKLYTDGRKQFYCVSSLSVKSSNRSMHNNGSGGGNGNTFSNANEGNCGATATPANSLASMTVINVPHQQRFQLHQQRQHQLDAVDRRKSPTLRITDSALRRSNATKNLESKKRVVKMLFVLVLEFFICWTPLYVINTVGMFIGQAMYEYIDYTSISFFQLLAYSSSCCNPITYCFMNAGFRRAFLDTFKGIQFSGGRFWRKRTKSSNSQSGGGGGGGNSIAMTTSVTMISNYTLESPRR